MEFFPGRRICRLIAAQLSGFVVFAFSTLNLYSANIGTVIPVVGQVSDLVYDPAHNSVYLANPTRNEVEIYSVDSGKLAGSVTAGVQPGSVALFGNMLYVANVGSLTISAIDTNAQRVVAEYFIGSRPDSIAVGSDGKVVILGTAGLLRLDPARSLITPVPISPPPTPVTGVTVGTSPTPANFLAGLVAAANGNLIIGMSLPTIAGNIPPRLFVYEVASGTVLRSRNVSGLRAILSASTDGSRFMAGPFLFDTQTLSVLGRSGTTSTTLSGGSAFSVDGNAVYSYFSTQNPINPLNTNQPPGASLPGNVETPPSGQTQAVLQVLRSSSLAPQLGLRLAEPITSKMVASTDGQYLFANSTSGLLVIPVGQLSNLPVLDISTTNVVLSLDPCNRTVTSASVQVRNTGGGRMTFQAASSNTGAPVVLNVRSGVAPATLDISFDARGFTTFGTVQYAIVLTSPEAVNVEPAILLTINYRDVSQRGTVTPFNGVGVDMQMDAARRRLYIANYTQDQIEVFSLADQTFLPPIRVGNRPLSMAIADANTLVVANSGGENLSVVDLDAMQEIDEIPMGPIAFNATPLFPRSIAASSNAILFTAVPLQTSTALQPGAGSVWQLSLLTHTAFPLRNLGAGNTANTIQGRNLVVAPADGSAIVLVEGNGTLRLYDPIADTFAVTRTTALPSTLRGTASAASDGSSYVVDNSVFNSVLTLRGAIAATPTGPIGPGAQSAAFGDVINGNTVIRVQAAATTPPPQGPQPVQSLQRFNLATLQMDLSLALPEPVLDITPAQVGVPTGTRQWPPRPTALELGTNNQTQLLPRGLAADSNNNVYLLTYSGLTIVSLTPAAGRIPTFSAGGVVNSPSRTGPVSAGALISIIGNNLADTDSATATPLPLSLGGVCVTANELTIPLLTTSLTKIDAQLPPNLPTGRVTLTVRSTKLGVSSPGVQVQVNASSPSIFPITIDGEDRAVLFHSSDMTLVTPDYPADRDEILILYATGLGPTRPTIPAGQLTPDVPTAATTQPISVSIGGHPYEVILSQLAPGYVGVYQIVIYVPGDRVQGNDLPVVVRAGGASSAINGAPLAAIQ